MKSVLVAAAVLGIADPAFAQDQMRVTAQQCLNAGGTIDQSTSACRIVDEDSLQTVSTQGEVGLGAGLGGAGAVAAVALLLVVAVAGSSDGVATTTTTGN